MNTFWLYYRIVKSFTLADKTLPVWWSCSSQKVWLPKKKGNEIKPCRKTMRIAHSVGSKLYISFMPHTQYGHHHVLHPILIDSFVIDSLSLHVKLHTLHHITLTTFNPCSNLCCPFPAASGLQVYAQTPPTTSAGNMTPVKGPRPPKEML